MSSKNIKDKCLLTKPRKQTKSVKIGDIEIGNLASLSIQSMTTIKTANIDQCVGQIHSLNLAGCDIVRVAIADKSDASALSEIIDKVQVPIVADIHFDHRLALMSIENGVHALRINPGNIGADSKVKEIAKLANERNIPIRVGANSGSLDKKFIEKYQGVSAEGLVESTMEQIHILEDAGFNQIKVSLKATDIETSLKANYLFSEEYDYPLHIGLTEAGTLLTGSVRSTMFFTRLLADGIGDTIRYSLAADPVKEVHSAITLLSSFMLLEGHLRVIACPTCGRTKAGDLFQIAEIIEKKLSHIKKPITVAIMGCTVNGPGEAKEADIGVAFGNKNAILFKKGKTIGTINENEIEKTIISEVEKMTESSD